MGDHQLSKAGISVFANDRLRLSVTDSCNLTCLYCTNEGQKHNAKNFLSPVWWTGFTEKVLAEGIYIRKLNITGGEPLLHPELDAIISQAVTIAESVSLNTNGILLSPGRVSELSELGLHNIKFGVDWVFGGATKPLLRPSKTDTAQLLASVKTAVKLMPRSSLNVVVSQFNAAFIAEIIEFVLEQKIDKVELLELIEHDFRKRGTPLVRPTSANDIVASMRGRFDRLEYNPRLAKYLCWTREGVMVQVAEDFCLRRVCRNLWTRIDARGRFLPCIKGEDVYEIDLSRPVVPQIRGISALMCSGGEHSVPRSTDGSLLPSGGQGIYEPVDLALLAEQGVSVTRLDP